jgi:hypothetical protein
MLRTLLRKEQAHGQSPRSGSLSNGLKRTATESACAACKRVLASVLPVISITGKPRPERLRTSHISIPVISGMSMSTTMQAFDVGISLAISSDGLANILTENPEAEISLVKPRRTDGSSSATSTIHGLESACARRTGLWMRSKFHPLLGIDDTQQVARSGCPGFKRSASRVSCSASASIPRPLSTTERLKCGSE